MFTDCLCFFAELRANLVGRLLRSDREEACKESRIQTQDVHADTSYLLAQFEWLYQTFLVNQAAFLDAFLWCSIVIVTGPGTVSTLKVKFSFVDLQAVFNTKSAALPNITPRSVFFGVLAEGLKAVLEAFVAHEASTVEDAEMKERLEALLGRITAEVNAKVNKRKLAQDGEIRLRWTLESALHRPPHSPESPQNFGSALLHGLGLSLGVGQAANDLVIDLLPTRRAHTNGFIEHQVSFGKVHRIYTAVLDSAGTFAITQTAIACS